MFSQMSCEATVDLSSCRWNNVAGFNSWERSEIKTAESTSKGLMTSLWLLQLPTSRSAAHSYLPWESRYDRQCRIRAVMVNLQLFFPTDGVEVSTQPSKNESSVTPHLQATSMVWDKVLAEQTVPTQPLHRIGLRQSPPEQSREEPEPCSIPSQLKRKREVSGTGINFQPPPFH